MSAFPIAILKWATTRFTINSCCCPIYFELENRQSKEKGTMGELDTILIENVNCVKALQPIIFNWQVDPKNKIKNITLSNVTIHDFATKPEGNLTPMSGGYPDANGHAAWTG